MPVTASKLRADIYRILDSVIESGTPVEIERKGHRLRIVAVDPPNRLDNLRPRPGAIKGDPGDLVDISWENEWRP